MNNSFFVLNYPRIQANILASTFIEYLRHLIDQRGDLLLLQGDYQSAPIVDIERYRDAYYSARNQPYLLSEQQRHCEDLSGAERRSQHFWVMWRGQIVGTMRATPAPHELCTLAPAEVLARGSFPQRLEFGRLVSTGTGEDVAAISKKLIAAACLFGVTHGHQGVIAMCKSPQRRLFERFGLSAVPPQFVVPERNEGHYWLVQASWQEIIDAIPAADYPVAKPVAACPPSHTQPVFMD